MKYYLIIMVLALALASCDKDNFEPPQAVFEGRIVYQGEPVRVQGANGNTTTDFPVFFELWDKRYLNRSAIRVPIKPDGTYSVLLFDGEYKLTVPNNQGPFLWKKTAANNPDSITVNLNGSQQLDIEVMPYYMLRNEKFSVSGRTVTGSVKIDKIITDAVNGKNIERVSLYVNKTQFVDDGQNINKADKAGSTITDLTNVSLSTNVGTIVPSQNYVFARIGLKIAGVEDMIYSPSQKITLQ